MSNVCKHTNKRYPQRKRNEKKLKNKTSGKKNNKFLESRGFYGLHFLFKQKKKKKTRQK